MRREWFLLFRLSSIMKKTQNGVIRKIDIEKGESKTLEFKEAFPESKKYIKTILAFANTSGGQLLIGVKDDKTVVGVTADSTISIMDTISNAVSDLCVPMVMPNIYTTSVEGKTVIVVEVYPSKNTPHYLKSEGIENGTYIRIGATTRLADSTKIQELHMQGKHLSYDKVIYRGETVLQEDIEQLCMDINSYRKNYCTMHELTKAMPEVTLQGLINWEIIQKVGDLLVPTNAYMLLIGKGFPFSKIQCARFKGVDRSIFLDKKEYKGSLFDQLESAYEFIISHLHIGAEINGLVRKDIYEIPPAVLREILLNAITHRNYLMTSCIQVSIFDDRLEVTSPGSLYGGLTLDQALNGNSVLRNQGIAEVFAQAKLIESWGTGLQRIIQGCAEHGLAEPEFLESHMNFRINIYRTGKSSIKIVDKKSSIKTVDKKSSIKTIDKVDMKKTEKNLREILNFMKSDKEYTRDEIMQALELKESRTRDLLRILTKENKISKIGQRKNARYIRNT